MYGLSVRFPIRMIPSVCPEANKFQLVSPEIKGQVMII